MVDPPSAWRYGRYWEGERRILMDDYLVEMTRDKSITPTQS